ncbi:MAG: homocysteine S-methyltransferase family protein [Nanoarchaeota archaeon]|nr:homocysteine S-methyltransferase family protein [Nanoarchaeota archaeon]
MGRLSEALKQGHRFVLSGPFGTAVAEQLARDMDERPQMAAGVSVNKHLGAGTSALLTPEGQAYLRAIALGYMNSVPSEQGLVAVTPSFRLPKQMLEAAATVRGWDPHLPQMGLELCLDAVEVVSKALSASSRSIENTLLAMSVGPPFDCYTGGATPHDVTGKYLPQVLAAVRFCRLLDYLMFETVPSLKAAEGAAQAFTIAHEVFDIAESTATAKNMGTVVYINDLLTKARYFGSDGHHTLAPSYDPNEGRFVAIRQEKGYIISFCLDENGMVVEGPVGRGKSLNRVSLDNAITRLYETVDQERLLEPAGIGINCNSPRVTELALASLSQANLSRVVGIHPNASSEDDPGKYCTMTHQQAIALPDYAAVIERLVKRFDLKIVGGCCGTNAETMQELGKILRAA